MKRREKNMALVLLLASVMLTGCGTEINDTKDTTASNIQTEAQYSETEASDKENEAVDEAQDPQETQTEQQTEVVTDTEQYVDNPAAEGGEGDTNGFCDDEGTWITVYKNSSGQWVDESGMVYEFGDEGVTDQNGNFYPY